MKRYSAALCLLLFLALNCNTSFASQSDGEITIDSYRIFITNLEEHIRVTPDIHLTRGELRKVMRLRTEILNLLSDASSFQVVSDERLLLLQALNGEMIVTIWHEELSPMVELFDSEREINYIFNTRNPPVPSWITP